VKLYLDGALGSWGAAMIEPYSDNPNSTGLFMFNSTDDLDATVSAWALNGWQVNSHAIGDRANNYIIDSLQKAIQEDEERGGLGRELRHRIEHAQIMLPSDVVRMGNLGIIPSMQPTHATSDMRWAPDRLGPDRLNEAYPWSTALESAGVIPLGSDFPVEYVDPLLGFYAAITRQNASGWPEGGWLPEFRLNRPQTLKGFTWDAAFASFQEDELGSIEVGKWADFVIFKGNIMDETAPPTDVLNAEVIATYIAGSVVYEKQN
jgi:predicted amidohydrolase YtcJ